MMSLEYVIPPPTVNSIPIAGDTRRFAVNRIFCVGRNYADHAREMGHDPDREPPFFFMKPASAIVKAMTRMRSRLGTKIARFSRKPAKTAKAASDISLSIGRSSY